MGLSTSVLENIIKQLSAVSNQEGESLSSKVMTI